MPFLPELVLHWAEAPGWERILFRRGVTQLRLVTRRHHLHLSLDEAVKLIFAYDLGVDRWQT